MYWEKLKELRWAVGCEDWQSAIGIYREFRDETQSSQQGHSLEPTIDRLETYVQRRDQAHALELIDLLLVGAY